MYNYYPYCRSREKIVLMFVTLLMLVFRILMSGKILMFVILIVRHGILKIVMLAKFRQLFRMPIYMM